MLREQFTRTSSIANKSNIVSAFLVGNAIVWYFTILLLLQSQAHGLLFWIFHFLSLILSALAGASYARKIERSKFLNLWVFLGILASIMMIALHNASNMVDLALAAITGFSMGFGMPACMSYFTDTVPIENRGRVSGLAILVSGIGIGAFGFAEAINIVLVGLSLGIWRLSSFFVFQGAKEYRNTERKKSDLSYIAVLKQRSFLLYFVPWIMFSLVNYLVVPMTPAETAGYSGIIQTACLAGAAIVGGFLIDLVGRKRVAIAGFAMLGAGTAILGLWGTSLMEIPYEIVLFNAAIDGIAWGLLIVLFIMTLWGDLSLNSSSEKFYALGASPFFISKLLELTAGSELNRLITSSSALFSLTAFLLFLAVLPLAYAPETLPEKVMKDRDLKSYVEKAIKKANTESEKGAENKIPEEEDSVELSVNPAEDEDEQEVARKLAEKYY